MKDALVKMRALVSMKTCLIHALRADLESALAKYEEVKLANELLSHEVIRARDEIRRLNAQLEPWWKHLDETMQAKERGIKVKLELEEKVHGWKPNEVQS